MSYLYSLGNAYGGRTETDHILASVKEQVNLIDYFYFKPLFFYQ